MLEVKFADRGPAIRPMKNAVMSDSVTALVTWPVDVWFGGRRSITADLVFGGRKIERITLGAAAPGWEDFDRAILAAVEELHQSGVIGDDTWSVLAQRYDDKQLIELPMLIGAYQMIAYVQNTLRVRLREGNAGLAQR